MAPIPWKVSLHGGHCGEYCDHAKGTLREVLEAAVRFGYHTFGLSEHAPRLGAHLLYDAERQMGWDVPRLEANFERYARDSAALATEFEGRLAVLRGFEIEVAPEARYVEIMQGYRERYAFDYIVGSVHHVGEVLIDGPPEDFARAVEAHGGLEPLARAYYAKVGEMVERLRPEVVGHLDLIRRNAPSHHSVETQTVRRAALESLEAVRDAGAILDVNTAGYRKGLGCPYPRPWLVQAARDMGVPFCFGDDSHGPQQVGAGIQDARDYLLENGVTTVTLLAREERGIVHRTASLT